MAISQSQFDRLDCPWSKFPRSVQTMLRAFCSLDGDGNLCLDDYKLVAYLGHGAYSVVFQIRRGLDEPLVLKLLDIDVLREANAAIAEFTAGLRCQSKHVVSYERLAMLRKARRGTAARERDAVAYLVREFVPGTTLTHEGLEKLHPDDRLRIFRQLARGLWDIHESHLVHRDVRPQNAVYNGDTAKWLDLGQVRVYGQDPGRSVRASRPGGLCGVPPEGWSDGRVRYDCKDWNQRGDVFSFGIMLYYLLTGSCPWKPGSAGLGDEWEAPARTNKVPPKLQKLIKEMLKPCSSDRPTMQLVVRKLEDTAGGSVA